MNSVVRGWTVVGWMRTGQVVDQSSDDAHDVMASEESKVHISYLYPSEGWESLKGENFAHQHGSVDGVDDQSSDGSEERNSNGENSKGLNTEESERNWQMGQFPFNEDSVPESERCQQKKAAVPNNVNVFGGAQKVHLQFGQDVRSTLSKTICVARKSDKECSQSATKKQKSKQTHADHRIPKKAKKKRTIEESEDSQSD